MKITDKPQVIGHEIELSGKSRSARSIAINISGPFDLQLDDFYIYRAPRDTLPEEKRKAYASAQDVREVCDLLIERANALKDSL